MYEIDEKDPKTQELIKMLEMTYKLGQEVFDSQFDQYIEIGYEDKEAVGAVTEEVLAIQEEDLARIQKSFKYKSRSREGFLDESTDIRETFRGFLARWIKNKGYKPSDFGVFIH